MSRKAPSCKPTQTDPVYLRDTLSIRSSSQGQCSSQCSEGSQARCSAWILLALLLQAAACPSEALRQRMWDEHRSKDKLVTKCILKWRDTAGKERPKDNGMYSSSAGQFLLPFRSAVVQVVIIWSVLLNQFGSLNTVANV